MAPCATTAWRCLLLAAAAACLLLPAQGSSAPFPPLTSNVQMMSDSQFVCDGTLRYLSIPQSPYPTNDNKDSPYNLPTGITCSRPRGGISGDGFGDKCGGLASIDCLPFAGIGPINSAPVGTPDNLALPPGNGLEFKLNLDSRIILTFVNWTVWDVGTGGAKFVAKYSGGGEETLTHSWERNGPQSGNSQCGACTNCELGKGIKSFAASARGNQGITGFVLSQLYTDVRCGATCFDLDASYWTGMSYTCVAPTCGDTDPTDSKKTPFDCGSTGELNPIKAGSTDVTTQNCCLKRTCANPNPASKPGIPVNCASFESKETTCAPLPNFNTLPLPSSPILCCDCKPKAASAVDVAIQMSVTPSTTTVGKKFTYTITVDLLALPPATAENVVVRQQLPSSFRIESVDDLNNDGRVSTSGSEVTVSYRAITTPNSQRVIRVVVVAEQPGTRLSSTATVSTTTAETDYLNNQDTVSVTVTETIPDLSIAIQGPLTPGKPGDRFQFTITVRMTSPSSPSTARDVKVIAPFPQGLTIVSAFESPSTGGSIIPGPSVLQASWNSMSFPNDDVKTIVVYAEAKQAGTFPVPASVSTTTQESNYNNNQATAVVVVRDDGSGPGTMDLSITMSSSSRVVQINQIFQYNINVKMTATAFNTIAKFVQVTSNMPAGIVIESVEENPNRGAMIKLNPSRTQLTVTWMSMSYPNDDSRMVIVNARATKQGTFDTSARVSSTTEETTLINNEANVVVQSSGSQPGFGACCNRQTGMCQDNVPESQCSGIWSASGVCQAGGFCSGACCRGGSSCAQTLKKDCYDGSWSLYGSCTNCGGGGSCTPEWQRCDPSSNNCCNGLSCEYTYAGCKVGSYVCKSNPNSECVGEGSPCGGASGYTCCKGTSCQWDYYQNQGTCRSSSGCIPPGGGCSNDYSVCRGCLCMGGKSKHVTYNMCNKKCSSYNCYYQRQINCQCFYASAASL